MKRIMGLAVLAVFAAAAFWFAPKPQSAISLTSATAAPVAGVAGMYMVSVTIENDGPPAVLTSAASPEASMVSFMNPAAPAAALIVPANGTGILAMDGAHIMLRADPERFEQGAMIPLSLSFADGSEATTRVLNTGPSTMQHGVANGVSVTPAPTLTLSIPDGPKAEGFTLKLQVENFSFVQTTEDIPHVPNEGHAHVYLNGLKLGRLYGTSFQISALSPGAYEVSVSLNTNDHRPYVQGDSPIAQTLSFVLPE